jgi:hypothetical protein
MTTNNNSTISAEEYEALQSNELSDNEVKKMFLARFKFEHRPSSGIYKPSTEAEHFKTRPYMGYYINYSFPQYGDKPLASVWTTHKDNGEERFRIFHIDLDKFTTMLVDEMLNHGFNPPPAKLKGYKKPTVDHQVDEQPY